jgi:hypothetical protein
MNPRSEHRHEVRRVVLPSGKTLEVVYFEAAPAGPAAPGTELHVCPACSSELVHPVDWREVGRGRWEIELRCPSCEWTGSGVWSDDAVAAFDEVLDRGTQTLIRDLRRLARANMEDDIERFAAALQADLLLPEDF